jgi:hypothetical protein
MTCTCCKELEKQLHDLQPMRGQEADMRKLKDRLNAWDKENRASCTCCHELAKQLHDLQLNVIALEEIVKELAEEKQDDPAE